MRLGRAPLQQSIRCVYHSGGVGRAERDVDIGSEIHYTSNEVCVCACVCSMCPIPARSLPNYSINAERRSAAVARVRRCRVAQLLSIQRTRSAAVAARKAGGTGRMRGSSPVPADLRASAVEFLPRGTGARNDDRQHGRNSSFVGGVARRNDPL